jgi:hypothetical protein
MDTNKPAAFADVLLARRTSYSSARSTVALMSHRKRSLLSLIIPGGAAGTVGTALWSITSGKSQQAPLTGKIAICAPSHPCDCHANPSQARSRRISTARTLVAPALPCLRGPFKRLLRRSSTQARGVDHVAPKRVVSGSTYRRTLPPHRSYFFPRHLFETSSLREPSPWERPSFVNHRSGHLLPRRTRGASSSTPRLYNSLSIYSGNTPGIYQP